MSATSCGKAPSSKDANCHDPVIHCTLKKVMTKYVSLPFNKKLNLLRDHSMGCEWPDLDQEHWCLHCNQKFSGHSVRVWQDAEGSIWLECGSPAEANPPRPARR